MTILIRAGFVFVLIAVGAPWLVFLAGRRVVMWLVDRCHAIDKAIDSLFNFLVDENK